MRLYPWSQRENPPATRYLTPDPDKVTQVPTMPRGMEYWERLAAVIEHEPVEDRDRFFVAMLKPLGIEKGKPFKPDERQKKILTEAAFVGEAMAKANDFDKRFEGARYRPDAHWDYVIMAGPGAGPRRTTASSTNARPTSTRRSFLTKAMISKTPGIGQAYLGSYRDKEGHAFDGATELPAARAAEPAGEAVLVGHGLRCGHPRLIQNKEQIADRSSRQPDLVKNADGSVDLYFGPAAPKGFEKNWIPTVPGKAWFA